MKTDTLTENERQIREKNMMAQRMREEEYANQRIQSENRKLMQDMQAYEKDEASRQRNDYLDTLKRQVREIWFKIKAM